MARLETTGFELGSLTAGMEFDTITNATARLSIQATTVRSGGFALQANNTVATDDDATVTKAYLASGGNSNDHHFRVYVRIATALSAARTIFSTRDVGAAINVFGIRLNTDNTLTLQDTGNVTTIGANSAALTTNTWYRIEVSFIFNATTPTVTAYIDGSSFASGTLANNANNNPSQYTVGLAGSNFTGNVFFDDIAINDSSGTAQTGLPGDGSVKLLVPTGTGDAAGWTPFGAANWQNVDEIPPTDATDFNTINTLNATDMFNITNSGIGASDTVSVVHVGGRFNNQLASANSAFKFRVEKAAAGTKSDSAAIIPNSVTWRTNAKATPFVWPLTLYLDPDGAAWTQTTLDSAQIGYIMSTNGTQSIQVSGVWMLIDTTAVVATTTSTSSTSTSTTRSTSTSSTSTSHSTSSTSTSISTSSTSTSLSTSSTSTSISTSSTSTSLSTSSTSSSISTSSTSTSQSFTTSTSSTSTSISTSSTSTSISTSTTISTSSTSTSISTSSTSTSISTSSTSTSVSTSLSTSSTSTSHSTSTTTSTTTPAISVLDMLGFETGDTGSLTITGSGLTATTSPVYSGGFALDVNTSATTGYHTGGAPASTGINGVFAKTALGIQFRLNIQSLPTGNTKIFRISNFSAQEAVSLRLNTDGTLTLLDFAGTVVGTSSALSTSTWYRITVKGTQNDTTGTAAAALNGVEFANGTGLNTTGSTWAQYTLGVFTSTTAHLVFDDFWLGDQAVYPPDVRILNLKPDSVGSNDAWTGTFADIDDTPISETDGRSDATLNDTFLNNLQDTATVGISGTIWGIKAWDWWKSTDATGKTDFRVKDSAITSTTTANNSTTSQYKANVQQNGISSGVTWTLSDLDALQVGAKTTVAPAGGQTVNVYAAGIEVAFDSTNGTSTSTSSTSSSTSVSTSSTSTSHSTSTSSTSTSISTSSTSTSISTSSTSTSVSTSSTSTSRSTSTSSTSTSISTSSTSTSQSTSTSSTSTSVSTSSTSTSVSTSSTSTSQSTSTSSTSTSISTSSTSTSVSTSSTSTSRSTSTSSTSTSVSTSSTSTSQSTSTSSTSTSFSTSSTSTSISTSSTSTSQSTSTSISTSSTSTSLTQSFTTSTSSTSQSISTSSTSTSISTSSTSTSRSTSTSSTSTSISTSSTSTSVSTSSTSTSRSTSTSSTSTSISTSSTSTSQSTSTSSTSTSRSTSTSSTSSSTSHSTSSTSTSITTSTSTSSTSVSTSSTSTSISTSTTLPPDARTKTQIRVVIDKRATRTRIQTSLIRIQKSQVSKVKVWSNED